MTTQTMPHKPVFAWKGPQRLLLIAGILGYISLFQWTYLHFLYVHFDYLGYDYNPPPQKFLVLAWILASLPSLWMPLDLVRPSQLAYWVLYITVVIPSMFVPLFAGLEPPAEVSLLMLALFVGFAVVGSCYLLPLIAFRRVVVSSSTFWRMVAILASALACWLIVKFREHLRIVSFLDVYDLRDATSEAGEGSQVNYAFMLLTGALNPLFMACGLYYKRTWIFLAGVMGQLLIYSVGGTKGSLLSILFVPGLYWLLKGRRFSFGLKLSYAAAMLLGGLCLSYALSGYNPNPIHFLLLFVVMMRTLSINGLVTAQYFDFFQRNPLTHFSHVKGVSWFLPYPYSNPVGMEVGAFYSGPGGLDATAHFWASDGITGMGLPGLLLVSVLCGLVFWTLDSAAQRHDPKLSALVISYAAYNLANIGIFTSLLSGGLMLLIAILYIMQPGRPPSWSLPQGQRANSFYPPSSLPVFRP